MTGRINWIKLKSRFSVVHAEIMPKLSADTVTFQHIKNNRYGVGKKKKKFHREGTVLIS